jgi:hypothetical protein
VLEIIFTLLTVKVGWAPEEEPVPVAPVLLGLEELGLLEPEADELLSVPIIRT